MTPQVIVERHLTADRLNEIVNDPSIYPWVRGAYEGKLDFTPLVEDQANVLVMGEHGGIFFVQQIPGLYEVHTQILPSGRGKWAVECVRGCLTYLFTRTNAVECMTRVPYGNIAAKALVKVVGGTREFSNPKGWIKDGRELSTEIYSLTIQDWTRAAPDLPIWGEWLRRKVAGEYARIGRDDAPEMFDGQYDRYVGSAIAMLIGGQPGKAMAFYNRWAALAGAFPIKLLSAEPLTLDCGGVVLVNHGHDFMVMPGGPICR